MKYEMKNMEVVKPVKCYKNDELMYRIHDPKTNQFKTIWHMPEESNECVYKDLDIATMFIANDSVVKMAYCDGCKSCHKYIKDDCWVSHSLSDTGFELMRARNLDVIQNIDNEEYSDKYNDIKSKYQKFLRIMEETNPKFELYNEKNKNARNIKACVYTNFNQILQDEDYAIELYNGENCWCSKDHNECFIHNFIEEVAFIVLTEKFGYDL